MRSGATGLDRFSRSPIRAALALAIMAYLPAWPALAQSTQVPDASATFNIPAGDLAGALDQVSTQTGIQLMYQPGLVAGKQARALSGRMTLQEALGRLLQDSGLEYGRVNATTIVIRRSGDGAKSDARPAAAPSPNKPTTSEKAPVTDMTAMMVTGTRIRGGTTPSPVITIGAENIREEGFTDLGEVIRSVPQNFTGGQNPGVLMGNVTGGGLANQNVTGGSGLNLRGLGPDASLTLLNGRRLSYGGFSQAVDISAIPVDAVERVEIVADGASAIYGSDAVGGVGNVILKRDYDGLTLGWRYGAATGGGLATREYNATAGTSWTGGGLIATYKKVITDPIYASQRDYTDQLPEPQTIYPGSVLNSGLVSAHQAIGEAVEFRLDALQTRRDQTYYYTIGDPSSYDVLTPKTKTTFVSPSIEVSLPGDWLMTIGGAWGKDDLVDDHSIYDIAAGKLEPYIYDCYCNKSQVYEVSAEGPLFEMHGGDARLAVGAGYRKNEFQWTTRLVASSPNAMHGSDSSRFAYAELNLPLVTPSSNANGTQRLDLTVAARGEDYGNFGRVSTPKFGLVYSPNSDFTIKASWGRSFKAPTLFEQYRPRIAQPSPVPYFGGVGYPSDATVLILGGGNPNLKPERARTWSASLAFHPEAVSGLEAELSLFDIDYTDRVAEPITNWSQTLSSPNYADFVVPAPTAAEQAQAIATSDIFYNVAGAPYDPSKVVALVHGRYLNVNQQRIKGADLSGSYRFELGAGQMTVNGAASWLDSSQRTSSSLASYELAGTLFNPAKVRGRLGAVWVNGGFSASGFLNYVGGIASTSGGQKMGSFTTFDATLRYGTGERHDAWSGLDFALAAQNLLNRKPPLYAPVHPEYVAPYDSTNYSAIGRYLSLSVSKHW